MTSGEWVSLLEYSAKHGVSISTLRRKIKGHEIVFKLDSGKYYLLDSESEAKAKPVEEVAPIHASQPNENHSLVFNSAQQLLAELKKAYTTILHEKDEQIRTLREEIADLKTLIRVLESQGRGY